MMMNPPINTPGAIPTQAAPAPQMQPAPTGVPQEPMPANALQRSGVDKGELGLPWAQTFKKPTVPGAPALGREIGDAVGDQIGMGAGSVF